jgi:hypothetical protein
MAATGGGIGFLGKNFIYAMEKVKETEKRFHKNIRLETRECRLPLKYREDVPHEKTPRPDAESVVCLELMKPVSYTPRLKEEEKSEPVAENKKPFAWKGRHDSKPNSDTRSPEKKEKDAMLDASSNSSMTESRQEDTDTASDKNPKFELSPADFGYPKLKQKYFSYVEGHGLFIFDKYKIRVQALKHGHKTQYKRLKQAWNDSTSQRMARPEGQSGHIKLNDEAGYEFKTTHGPYRGIFVNNEENIAKTEKGKYQKVYKAKVYNGYSPTGLHKKS